MTDLEFFKPLWNEEHSKFVRVFKALPHDKLSFRPHEKSRSAAELTWLLIYEQKTLVELLETGKINWVETHPITPLDEMISMYEKNHEIISEKLGAMTQAEWSKKTTCTFPGNYVVEETVGQFFWSWLLDAIHHRGQLSVYIRLLGGKVPSIYGPSADEA